jgi:hypothetical protein
METDYTKFKSKTELFTCLNIFIYIFIMHHLTHHEEHNHDEDQNLHVFITTDWHMELLCSLPCTKKIEK